MILDASQRTESSVVYITAHGYCSSFKFNLYSQRPSNNQTTAVYNIKAASFQYIHITKTKHVPICSALHVYSNLQMRLCCTQLSDLDSRIESASMDLG